MQSGRTGPTAGGTKDPTLSLDLSAVLNESRKLSTSITPKSG